jgi:hypothetical protein
VKLLKLFNKDKQKNSQSSFADFFLHASENEMKEVITEAARRANEDQRSLIEKIKTLDHKAT